MRQSRRHRGGIAALCGGAFYTIIDSAIVDNRARFGGGAVFVNGFQTIVNSTFSGNVATNPDGIGGAIMNFADRLYMSNSTIANNTVRPGGGALAMFSAYNELRRTSFSTTWAATASTQSRSPR